MAYVIKDGYLIHIPGGTVFKTTEALWKAVDKHIAKKKENDNKRKD